MNEQIEHSDNMTIVTLSNDTTTSLLKAAATFIETHPTWQLTNILYNRHRQDLSLIYNKVHQPQSDFVKKVVETAKKYYPPNIIVKR